LEVDLGSRSRLGRPAVLLLGTNNRCIPAKNALSLSAIVFCACEMIQLLSLVLFVVKVVHKFDF